MKARRYPGSWAAALLALLVLGACSDANETVTAPGADELAPSVQDATTGGWDLPLMNAARLSRAFPASPCSGPEYREFDFWVGEWNVFGTDDTFFGTNVVTSELDGCLVQEHWTASNGTRGRSLNVYDAETDMWHQDWASQVPIPNGLTVRLRTSGGLEDDTMVLTGERNAVAGFTFFDTWTWTEDAQGNVIQTGQTEVPAFGIDSEFTAVYKRGTPTPITENVTPHCQAGQAWGATRDADFLVGSYDVSAGSGVAVGSATIETDLSDCVFVERFESRGGLEAIAFTYYDAWVEAWFRVYVDSEGERLVLRGGFDDGSLVLQGTEGTQSGDVEARVSWTPQGSGFLQTWEVSTDGGGTWKQTATLDYVAG